MITPETPTCPHCGGPLEKSVGFVCFGGGKGGRVVTWHCPDPTCRADRDEAAIADAVARGVIAP